MRTCRITIRFSFKKKTVYYKAEGIADSCGSPTRMERAGEGEGGEINDLVFLAVSMEKGMGRRYIAP